MIYVGCAVGFMRQVTFLFETPKDAANGGLFQIMVAGHNSVDCFHRTGFDLPHRLHHFAFQLGKRWTHGGARLCLLCHGTSCTTHRNRCQAISSWITGSTFTNRLLAMQPVPSSESPADCAEPEISGLVRNPMQVTC